MKKKIVCNETAKNEGFTIFLFKLCQFFPNFMIFNKLVMFYVRVLKIMILAKCGGCSFMLKCPFYVISSKTSLFFQIVCLFGILSDIFFYRSLLQKGF